MEDEMVDRAMIVARLAFMDNPDAFAHTQRVAQSIPADDRVGRTVALLHDVVEDTAVTIDLMRGWFSPDVLDAVETLTRREGEAYWDYVARIAAAGGLARRVKIADATDNLARSRRDRPGMVKRYERVLRELDAAADAAA